MKAAKVNHGILNRGLDMGEKPVLLSGAAGSRQPTRLEGDIRSAVRRPL